MQSFRRKTFFTRSFENKIHHIKLKFTRTLISEAGGWGPGAPLASCPRATLALNWLCRSVINLASSALIPLLGTRLPHLAPRPLCWHNVCWGVNLQYCCCAKHTFANIRHRDITTSVFIVSTVKEKHNRC